MRRFRPMTQTLTKIAGAKTVAAIKAMVEGAATVAAVKDVHDRACGLAEEAAAAQNFALLDEAIAIAHACERKGGAMLRDGAANVRGIDTKRWRRRARMDDEHFWGALRRAQNWWRARARPPAVKAERHRDPGFPQARMIVTNWRADEFGNRTRYVAGVCARRYKELAAAGRSRDELAAELLAEVLERAA
jgi:hypothetical protein